ncbi:MAG TPA: DUF2071 domain-containing protein [Herpetosiphonaceae bacterium]
MNTNDQLRFTPDLLARPTHGPLDVVTRLRHFAILTYTVEPQALARQLHPRFEPDCIRLADGRERALVSVVPFQDEDFHFVGLPLLRFCFGQTNYRAYVRDRLTGERAVWFFGTALDSASVLIPRYLWKLPWHRGRIRFDCRFDASRGAYAAYRMQTESAWAPADLEVEDTGERITTLDGFDDLERGMVLLTHPLRGFFYRRDGALGSYSIWHDRLAPTRGRCRHARFPLLDRLGLVSLADQVYPHSVLLQQETEFSIYLPPRKVRL